MADIGTPKRIRTVPEPIEVPEELPQPTEPRPEPEPVK